MLPFARDPQPTQPVQGLVVYVGKETVDVKTGASVLRNVGIALPLAIEQVANRDIVAMTWYADIPFVTSVLGHETALRDSPIDDTEPPPAPKNVRVVQGIFGARLEWDWGGSAHEKRDLSYYEVDAQLTGQDWGYSYYPVSEGTREVHYSDSGTSVLCRVRAVDFRGNESAWVKADGLLEDSVAPTAPWGFAVEDSVSEVEVSWSGPTTSSIADLAGYYLYHTDDASATSTGSAWTGTGAKVATISADTLSTTYPMDPGQVGYFNLSSFDTSGNESELAVIGWLVGKGYPMGGQLLTNADWERGDPVADTIIDWDLTDNSVVEYTPNYMEGIGYDGGRGIQFGYVGVGSKVGTVWWPSSTAVQVRAIDDSMYTLSVYVYTQNSTIDQLMDTDSLPYIRMHPYIHNGTDFSSYAHWDDVDSGYTDLLNGWYRAWNRVIFRLDPNNPDYKYLGAAYSIVCAGVASPGVLDRPMFNLGPLPAEWTLLSARPVSSAGLSIDTAGIVSDGIVINEDGDVASDLIPSADNTYDVGGTNRWKDGNFSGDLAANALNTVYVSATGGVTSTGDISYGGGLKPTRGGTEYAGYVFVPLLEAITHTSFFGDSFSDVSTSTKIENTSWSTTIPADAKALSLRVRHKDSGSEGSGTYYFACGPSSTQWAAFVSYLSGVPNDITDGEVGICPCTDGDIWYQISASGTNTMDVWLYCWGYWI